MDNNVSTDYKMDNDNKHDQNLNDLKDQILNIEYKPPDILIHSLENSKNDTEPEKHIEHNKKANLMTKIFRRLSKSPLFSKDKKPKKRKDNGKVSHGTDQQSFSAAVKSNTIGGYSNRQTPKSKGFRNILHRFSKKKDECNILSEPENSIDSKPSISSSVNATIQVHSMNSCNDQLLREKIQNCTPLSINRILNPEVEMTSKENKSVANNSIDLQDDEVKICSMLHKEVSTVAKSQEKHILFMTDQDKLIPIQRDLTLTSNIEDIDKPYEKPIFVRNASNSSNVRLTLSLYGYNSYGLKSSRINSKSCIEFRSAIIPSKSQVSMDNIALFVEKVTSVGFINAFDDATNIINENNDDLEGRTPKRISFKGDIVESLEVNNLSNEIENDCSENVPSDDILRKSGRPTEIQLRRNRTSSQSSIARSSLIMVAVSQNTPRNKGFGNQVTTPVLAVDSPSCYGKKFEFVEENVAVDEERIGKVERDGHYFLVVANQYENELNNKIEVVQQYLESFLGEMNEDVIGELNSTVGLAKLLLSEKFVQFKGLCEQNINDSNDNEFRTLVCDLEGYLTTLEIQMADLNKNFLFVEKVRANNWQIPATNSPDLKSTIPRRKSKPKAIKATPADSKRSAEAKKRLAEYKKISVSSNQTNTNLINFC